MWPDFERFQWTLSTSKFSLNRVDILITSTLVTPPDTITPRSHMPYPLPEPAAMFRYLQNRQKQVAEKKCGQCHRYNWMWIPVYEIQLKKLPSLGGGFR